jgi:hypothetical protein
LADGIVPLNVRIPDEVEGYACELADAFMEFMRSQSISVPLALFHDPITVKQAHMAIRDTYLRAALAYIPWALHRLRRDYRGLRVGRHRPRES